MVYRVYNLPNRRYIYVYICIIPFYIFDITLKIFFDKGKNKRKKNERREKKRFDF